MPVRAGQEAEAQMLNLEKAAGQQLPGEGLIASGSPWGPAWPVRAKSKVLLPPPDRSEPCPCGRSGAAARDAHSPCPGLPLPLPGMPAPPARGSPGAGTEQPVEKKNN